MPTGQVYLGSRQGLGSARIPNDEMATTIKYNMEDFLELSIAKYLELAGVGTTLRGCATLFVPDDRKESPARAPGVVLVTECLWCLHIASPTAFHNVLL